MMRLELAEISLLASIEVKSFCNPSLQNNAMVTSIPKSAWKALIFFVFKKPFKYAVAGYGVFNCVNGGVNKKMEALNTGNLQQDSAIINIQWSIFKAQY